MRQLTVSNLAEIIGTTRRTLNNRIAHLTPDRCEGKMKYYNSDTAIRAFYLVELRRQFENEFKAQMKDVETLPSYDDSVDKNRLQRAKADMEELKFKEKMGEVVAVEDILAEVEKEYTLVRTALLSLPTKKAKILSGIDDPATIQVELDDAINEALAHLEKDKNG